VCMTFGPAGANYDLGHFGLARRGPFTIIISNTPSLHDDAVCHAEVVIKEALPK
jgi:hypothetical protein